MKYRKEIALIGSLMLFIGPFFPFMSAPVMGSLTYFRNGTGDGVIVFALAIVAICLAAFEMYKYLIPVAIGSACTIAFTAFNISSKMQELDKARTADTAGDAFSGLANTAIFFIQIQWGMPFMLIAVMLLLYASVDHTEKIKLASDCPYCGGLIPIGQTVCNHCKNQVLWLRDKARKPAREVPSAIREVEKE